MLTLVSKFSCLASDEVCWFQNITSILPFFYKVNFSQSLIDKSMFLKTNSSTQSDMYNCLCQVLDSIG